MNILQDLLLENEQENRRDQRKEKEVFLSNVIKTFTLDQVIDAL